MSGELSEKTTFGSLRILNFMRFRRPATLLSVVLVACAVISLLVRGLNFGLDFTGGTLVELSYDRPVNMEQVRGTLERMGYSDATAQEYGSQRDVLIRLPGMAAGNDAGVKMARELVVAGGDVVVRRVEFVGPQVGEKLRDQGGLGMLLALALVMLYVAMRFQYKFSFGAVVALAHDSVLVLGLFSLLHLPFDLSVLAALLAVIGYSLNDTIIVYDRVRENFRKVRRGTPIDVINISLSQTLGRTLATSGTTIMVLLALFFLGGDMIHGFATALLAGVVVGTYSSIYIASNMLVYTNVTREDLVTPPPAENEEEIQP